jgi:hypothetical protein
MVSVHDGVSLDALRKVPPSYYIRLVEVEDIGQVLVIGQKRGDVERHCDMQLTQDNVTVQNIRTMIYNLQSSFRAAEFGDKYISVHRQLAIAARDGTRVPAEYREVIEALDADEREIAPLRDEGSNTINWAKYLGLVEQPVLH